MRIPVHIIPEEIMTQIMTQHNMYALDHHGRIIVGINKGMYSLLPKPAELTASVSANTSSSTATMSPGTPTASDAPSRDQSHFALLSTISASKLLSADTPST